MLPAVSPTRPLAAVALALITLAVAFAGLVVAIYTIWRWISG